MTENVTLVMLRYLKVFYIPLLLLSGFFLLQKKPVLIYPILALNIYGEGTLGLPVVLQRRAFLK